MGHLGQIAGGWAAAWRQRGLNPLRNYWRLSDQRAQARRRWWLRSPGLLGLAVLLSLICSAVLAVMLYRLLGYSGRVSSYLYPMSAFATGTSVLLSAAFLYCTLWLLARLYAAASLALGFLEIQARARVNQTLDDLLATSPLSAQDILIGVASHCLRLVFPPLAALSVVAAVIALFVNLPTAVPSTDWLALGWQAVLGLLRMLAGGVLATLLVTFMLVTLSLAQRANLAPAIGAASQVLMQVLLFLCGISLLDFDPEFTAGYSFSVACQLGAAVLLLIGLLVYLARKVPWIRLALAYAFPLVLIGVALALSTPLFFELEDETIYSVGFGAAVWALQGLSVFSPLNQLPGAIAKLMPYSSDSTFSDWHYFLVLSALQIGLIAVFAEFARDAILRRKAQLGGIG